MIFEIFFHRFRQKYFFFQKSESDPLSTSSFQCNLLPSYIWYKFSEKCNFVISLWKHLKKVLKTVNHFGNLFLLIKMSVLHSSFQTQFFPFLSPKIAFSWRFDRFLCWILSFVLLYFCQKHNFVSSWPIWIFLKTWSVSCFAYIIVSYVFYDCIGFIVIFIFFTKDC